MAGSRLRSTAEGGLALMLSARCDTSCHVAGYYAPHEAGKFPGDSCFSNIGPLVIFKNHTIVLPPQPLVRFIGIGDDFRIVTILSGLERLGLESNLSSTITLGCFYQQTADMTVSGLSNSQAVLVATTGILARGKSDLGCKVLGRSKSFEIADLCKHSQSCHSLDTDEAGQLMNILLIGFI